MNKKYFLILFIILGWSVLHACNLSNLDTNTSLNELKQKVLVLKTKLITHKRENWSEEQAKLFSNCTKDLKYIENFIKESLEGKNDPLDADDFQSALEQAEDTVERYKQILEHSSKKKIEIWVKDTRNESLLKGYLLRDKGYRKLVVFPAGKNPEHKLIFIKDGELSKLHYKYHKPGYEYSYRYTVAVNGGVIGFYGTRHPLDLLKARYKNEEPSTHNLADSIEFSSKKAEGIVPEIQICIKDIDLDPNKGRTTLKPLTSGPWQSIFDFLEQGEKNFYSVED